jgi:hypothetical protein
MQHQEVPVKGGMVKMMTVNKYNNDAVTFTHLEGARLHC